jgi:DDE superfamily endonuclease
VVILDSAGWHRSQGLAVPGNVTLLALPPYSPELDPVARIWHYLRSRWLANSVFRSLADIVDTCEMAWNRFATDHRLIRSLCGLLGSGFARSEGGVCDQTAARNERHTSVRKLRSSVKKGVASGKQPGEDKPCQRPGISAP